MSALEEKDWKVRDDAITAVEAFVTQQGEAIQSQLSKLFDAFAPRLSDSNSKVRLRCTQQRRSKTAARPCLPPAGETGVLASTCVGGCAFASALYYLPLTNDCVSST